MTGDAAVTRAVAATGDAVIARGLTATGDSTIGGERPPPDEGIPALAVELRGIAKRFGPVWACRDASLELRRGEVHALVGENGAGKSTLMRVLYGMHLADAGEIRIGGHLILRTQHSPAAAIRHGVGMVHQHFMLAPALTVAENVVLGREPLRWRLLDLARAGRELRALSKRHGLRVEPERRVEELSVGEEQRVEILKLLYRGADVLILDEPTAVLSPPEVGELFAVVRSLCASGRSVILVTHKLDEVLRFADQVTVMRRGRVVAAWPARQVTAAEIARAMVGREVVPVSGGASGRVGESLLRVEGVCAERRRGVAALRDVSLEVRAGEVLGVAGVEGNGQSELAEVVAGLRVATAGRVLIAGRDVTRASPAARRQVGLAHVPEDRLRRGLVAEMSVGENLILGQQRWFTRRLALDRTAIAETVATRMRGCDIRPPVPAVAAAGLSGGNQQKIVVARELSCDFLVLLAAQPTRGVDIGAIELIHRQLLAARDAGKAVLLLSADLGEVLALSDRIAVLYRGRLAAVLERREASEERLGMLMTGAAGGTGAAIGSDAATGSSAATGSDAAGTTAVVAAEHAATADSTPHGETEGDGGPPR